MRASAYAIALSLTLACTGQVQADTEIFRWVDENGVVHYSDVPDDPDAAATDVKSTATDRQRVRQQELRAWEDRQRQAAEDQDADMQRAMDAQAAAEKERMRQLNCEAATQRAKLYGESHRLYETLPDGERRYLTDAELSAARSEALAEVDEWCQ